MKTKTQKAKEITQGEALLKDSEAVLFLDCANLKTSDLRVLRQELKTSGNPFFLIKKRLLGLVLKQKGIEFDHKKFKTSVGTVFASSMESAARSVYQFLYRLEKDKKIEAQGSAKKMLGGYDFRRDVSLENEYVAFLGKLPTREVVLGQFLGMLAAPIRSLLYILSEKSKRSSQS